jgi:hypothetical protein
VLVHERDTTPSDGEYFFKFRDLKVSPVATARRCNAYIRVNEKIKAALYEILLPRFPVYEWAIATKNARWLDAEEPGIEPHFLGSPQLRWLVREHGKNV